MGLHPRHDVPMVAARRQDQIVARSPADTNLRLLELMQLLTPVGRADLDTDQRLLLCEGTTGGRMCMSSSSDGSEQ